MLESWTALETEEGLRGWLLGVRGEGTQGKGTGVPGAYGDLGRHGSLGGQHGYPAHRTCGKALHEKDEDG